MEALLRQLPQGKKQQKRGSRMNYLTHKDIQLKCPWKLLSIEELEVHIEPNKHASIYAKALVEEETDIIQGSLKNEVIELLNKETQKIIFAAEITEATLIYENGVCYIEIRGLSGTSNLDLTKESRSFQETAMTYEEMIDSIIKTSKGTDAIYIEGKGKAIQVPLIQFRETNWTYIKRMASHFQSVVVPEVSSTQPRFWFGLPEGKRKTLDDSIEYEVKHETTLTRKPFFSYEIKHWDNMNIGDYNHFKGKEMIIYKKSISLKENLLIFAYSLCYRNSYQIMKKYNTIISGMAIQGTVLQTNKEQMRVHLDIDQKQDPSKAYWYDYVPTTGNMMYCMPKVGTRIALYFPDEKEEHAKIHYCVRTNGATSPALSDPSCRYFYTEHQKAWALLPTNLYFEAIQPSGTPKKLRIELPDATGPDAVDPNGSGADGFLGVRCSSPKKIFIMTIGEIQIKTKTFAHLNTMQSLTVYHGGTTTEYNACITITNDHHLVGNHIYFDTVPDKEEGEYAPFNDAPKEGEYHFWESALKIGGGLLAVVGGIAVACVCVAAIGPAALILGGAIVGAGISSVAVGMGEMSTGNNVSAKEYLIKLGIGAFTGAIGSIPGMPLAATVFLVAPGATMIGMGLEELLIEDTDYTVEDYVVQGVISIAFAGLASGINTIAAKFVNKLKGNTAQLDIQAVQNQIDDIDDKITQKYTTNGAMSGKKVKDLYLSKLSNQQLIDLCDQYNIPYNSSNPKGAINDLKRFIVNDPSVLGGAERSGLLAQQRSVDDLYKAEWKAYDKTDLKGEINSVQGPRVKKVLDGIKSYNNDMC